MDLLTPEAQESAHYWASVLLAHAFIGLFLVAVVAVLIDALAGDWIDGAGRLALVIVVCVYGLLWEGLAQGYGAGMADAAVDTLAVACGGLAGLSAWARRVAGLSVAFVVLAGVAAAGVWGRR